MQHVLNTSDRQGHVGTNANREIESDGKESRDPRRGSGPSEGRSFGRIYIFVCFIDLYLEVFRVYF